MKVKYSQHYILQVVFVTHSSRVLKLPFTPIEFFYELIVLYILIKNYLQIDSQKHLYINMYMYSSYYIFFTIYFSGTNYSLLFCCTFQLFHFFMIAAGEHSYAYITLHFSDYFPWVFIWGETLHHNILFNILCQCTIFCS